MDISTSPAYKADNLTAIDRNNRNEIFKHVLYATFTNVSKLTSVHRV